jgi:hypothetical protein
MRLPLLVVTTLAIAPPAMAQIISPPGLGLGLRPQDAIVQQQLESSRQQLIQQQNQLMTLDAQMRTQQALSQVQAQAVSPRLPEPDVTPGRPLPQIDTSQLASIPDAALADSNKKVLQAAGNRR